jgi:hypothetical protein
MVAKNYLAADELEVLNRIVTAWFGAWIVPSQWPDVSASVARRPGGPARATEQPSTRE